MSLSQHHQAKPPYVGRFAPTPTGPLHFGSLVAALASFLDAKAHQGKWLLRIEDLDPPREDPTASKLIPKQLLAHGLQWDGPIQYQSQHAQAYETALQTLKDKRLLFPCQCTRKQLAPNKGLHQGICSSTEDVPHAWRLNVPADEWGFNDSVYGKYSQHLQQDVGDQVLKRKDGFYAYQLAVVVDDFQSGITHVVRGVDLLDNTPRQLYLQQCLNYPQPSYTHLPLVTNDAGQKLSKQNQAQAINLDTPRENLLNALRFLNQPLPNDELYIPNILEWAVNHWSPDLIEASNAGVL